MQFERGRLASTEDQLAIGVDLAVDYQSWEIQESYRDSRFFNVEEVLDECDLVYEKLKFEEVLACWSS